MDKKFKWLLKQALKVREARIFLYYVIISCQTFNHGYVPGEPHATAFHAGQRSIGLMLFDAIIEIDPVLFTKMRAEYYEFITPAKKEDK